MTDGGDGVAGPVYLDYNATTPVDPRVLEAILPFLGSQFGNPSSSHAYGRAARGALDEARADVAALIGADPDRVVFTGSGTEADQLAIRGAALARCPRGGQVITQATEHPAVVDACRVLERDHDYTVTVLGVDESGTVDPADLQAALTPQTVLVTVMHANNETGTIEPIAELAEIAHAHGALFHTDAAQTPGKIAVDVLALGVDLLTIVGHKLYAPKGVAALYCAVPLRPVIGGGGQERGLRAGTENVALIAGLGQAARIATATQVRAAQQLGELRDRLHGELVRLLPGRVHVNGHMTRRLPNTLNVSIDGVDADRLLADAPAIAASTGSACHADRTDPSPVLLAMGCSPERARAAVRLSVGRWSTREQIDAAAAEIAAAAIRPSQPAPIR